MSSDSTATQGELGRRWYENVEVVSLSTSSATLATALTVGQLYVIQANVPVHVAFGNHGSTTATTSHFELGAYQPLEVKPPSSSLDGIAGILDAGTGKLYVLKVV